MAVSDCNRQIDRLVKQHAEERRLLRLTISGLIGIISAIVVSIKTHV